MTDKEVWDFFKAGRGKKKRLQELQKQLDQLEHSESYIKAIDYEKPSVSGGSMSDLSDTVLRGEEAKAKVKKSIAEMQAEIYEWQYRFYQMIRICTNGLHASILQRRFLDERSMKDIQEEYHYSRRRVTGICREAIREIATKFDE